ncbi:MAG: replication initiation protein [Desulfamplus sp.]|nr:replication initiation protein [Desulfamplus sp.]
MVIKKKTDGDRVKSSNAIARCRWTDSTDESVWEGRLLAIVASQIRQDDEDLKPYTFPITAVIGSNDGNCAYAAIEETVEKAMSRVVTIRGKDGWAKYNLFHECLCKRKEGTLIVQIHPKLKPHYLNLKSNFTQYSLFEYMVIPSVYSQRLFVLLKSWDDKPEVTIDLNELREMLGVTGYKTFPELRRKILEPGDRHIHQHTTLIYSWEPVKLGQRKVIAIRFIFSLKRAAIVQKQEQAANSKRNNKLGLEAIRCFNEHNGKPCNHNRSKAVCEICKLLKP